METKVKHVRDAAYWGMPVGTPIEPGMKPVRTPRIRPKRVSSSSSGGKTPQTTGTIKPVADKPGDSKTPDVTPLDTSARSVADFSIESAAAELSKIAKDGRPDGAGTPEDPIDCGDDIDKAKKLLAEDKSIRLSTEREVSLLIDKIAEEARTAKEQGRDPFDYDLCKVTVPNTSLFCTDESVEMMTARGWKRYDDLVIGEPVLTIDHTTGLSHWEPLQAVNVFPAEKRTMLSIEGSLHSSLTTLDHRWAVLTDKRKGGLQRNWRTSETLKWDDKIPLAAPCVDLPTEVKYTDDLVALVAWAWTEGTISRNRSLRIYQSEATNQHHVARIRATLTSAFGKARVQGKGGRYTGDATELGWYETTNTTGVVSFHLTKAASDTVLCHMDDQKIVRPEFLTALTESQLRTFVDISVMADGCVMPDRRSFGQRVEGRARAFEQACALLGIPTHTTVEPDMRPRHQGKNMYRVALMTREVVKPYNLRMQRVEYDGLVWCPTTPNGTWLARRNGSVYITGNCGESKGIPRAQMPQFSGQPEPGTYADAHMNKMKGEANVTEEFAQLLDTMDLNVTETSVPVNELKATQSQLVGAKVAGMRDAMREGKIKDAPIYVTRDGYIVDGHHRWAAKMALDLEDGKLGDVEMPVKMIDADIGYILDVSNGFAKMAGIKPKGTGANAEGVKMIDVSTVYLGTIGALLDVYLARVKAILDQSPETKLRHVRDSAYWGMPDGTPIVPGMKPVKKPTTPRIVPNRPRSVGNDGSTVKKAPPFDPVRSPDTLPAEVLNKPDIIKFGEEDITRGKDSIWNHLVPDGDGGYKLTPERQEFYRSLIEPMVAGKPKQDKPVWTVLGGGGGSGKGFLQKKHPELFTDEDVTVKIDPDELKMVIHSADPEYDFLTKDDRAGFLHEESSVMAKMAQEVGFAKQAHVLLDGTGNSSLTKLTRKLDEGRKAGYTVNGVYVSVPTQLAWARNVKRGRTDNERAVVAPWAVSSAHQKVSQITPNAHRLYDRFEVFDMTGGEPVQIAQSSGGSDLEILDEDRFQGFMSKATSWSADELAAIEVPAAYLAAPPGSPERDYLPEWFFDYAARPGTKAVLFKAAEADIDDDLARTLMKNALLGYAFEDAGVPDTAVHRAAYAEIVNSVAQVRALCPDAEVIIPGEIPDPKRFGYAASLFDDGFIDSF